MRHAIRRKLHTWGPKSDARLLDAVRVYGTDNWNLGPFPEFERVQQPDGSSYSPPVARTVSEDATAQQCQNRFSRTLDPHLKRGPWSPEEDAQLHLAVDAYGNSWVDVAAFVPGRTNEQCRDRWSDRLNPDLIKGKWTVEEDRILLDAVEGLGPKWKSVSQRLGNGRTDKMVRSGTRKSSCLSADIVQCRSRYELLRKRLPSSTSSEIVAGSSKSRASRPHIIRFVDAQPKTHSEAEGVPASVSQQGGQPSLATGISDQQHPTETSQTSTPRDDQLDSGAGNRKGREKETVANGAVGFNANEEEQSNDLYTTGNDPATVEPDTNDSTKRKEMEDNIESPAKRRRAEEDDIPSTVIDVAQDRDEVDIDST
jgi:hypothetical protein